MGAHVSNVIQFLESMGSNALMARMSVAEYESTIDSLFEIKEQERVALRSRDSKVIGDVLDGREQMLCFVFAPDQDEQAPSREDDGADVPAPEEDSPVQE
jgi:hypothetical protein